MTVVEASAGPLPAQAEASPLKLWTNLWIVYIVWGSTYLAMRITDRTMPPLLMSSARFLVAAFSEAFPSGEAHLVIAGGFADDARAEAKARKVSRVV